MVSSLLGLHLFCAEGLWPCIAMRPLLARRYTDAWVLLADPRVRGMYCSSFRETRYSPSGTSPLLMALGPLEDQLQPKPWVWAIPVHCEMIRVLQTQQS